MFGQHRCGNLERGLRGTPPCLHTITGRAIFTAAWLNEDDLTAAVTQRKNVLFTARSMVCRRVLHRRHPSFDQGSGSEQNRVNAKRLRVHADRQTRASGMVAQSKRSKSGRTGRPCRCELQRRVISSKRQIRNGCVQCPIEKPRGSDTPGLCSSARLRAC